MHHADDTPIFQMNSVLLLGLTSGEVVEVHRLEVSHRG
jgi:hypothetical protein